MVGLRRASQLVAHPREGARAVARRIHTKPCLVCGSRRVRTQVVERKQRTYEIRICRRCHYVSNPSNTVDYSAFESVESFRLTPRVGTAEHQGREFHMARMGADILQRTGLEVMVFGAGRSLDYQHIGKLPAVDRVVMSDVVDLGVDADFINIAAGTSERFDLIIACEVVEHFTDPRTEFRRLFKLLKRGGLLVCSTNIYDGRNVANHRYLYSRGHVSYYSPRAIRVLARRSRMRYDFRLPAIVTGTAGPRKRYILLTRSRSNMRRIVDYFGSHAYAPSEDVGPTE